MLIDTQALTHFACLWHVVNHEEDEEIDDEKSMREAMSEILVAREVERAEREAKGEPVSGRRRNSLPSKADPQPFSDSDSRSVIDESATPATLRATQGCNCYFSALKSQDPDSSRELLCRLRRSLRH